MNKELKITTIREKYKDEWVVVQITKRINTITLSEALFL